MSANKCKYAFGLNSVLPEFTDTSMGANQIVKTINAEIKKSRSTPLKSVLDELYANDFNIPLDIIDLINVYEYGGISYHYSKTFEKQIENTIYITPIIFGYIETILFFSLFIFPFIIKHTLTPLLISYGLILFIHGICAIISYHKCCKYEIFIRQFKQTLHSNDKFYEKHKDKYDRNNIKNMNKITIALSNPSNNTFAYIAYQYWLNVKKLELVNDKFTRSRAAFCLSLSKYWLPSSLVFSFIVFVYGSDVISSIWLIVLIHLFNALGYCYFRVAEGSNQRTILTWTIIYVLLQDIFTAVIIIGVSGAEEEDNAEYWLTDVACPIFYGLASVLCSIYLCIILRKIIRFHKHKRKVYETQILWLANCMTFLFVAVLFGAPSWNIKPVAAVFSLGMVISYYMMLQQLIERIMTGLKTKDYVRRYMASYPQKWLKRELKFLFNPNAKLWHFCFIK